MATLSRGKRNDDARTLSNMDKMTLVDGTIIMVRIYLNS